MSGEMVQACKIVAAAKKALKNKAPIEFKSEKYDGDMVLEIQPR